MNGVELGRTEIMNNTSGRHLPDYWRVAMMEKTFQEGYRLSPSHERETLAVNKIEHICYPYVMTLNQRSEIFIIIFSMMQRNRAVITRNPGVLFTLDCFHHLQETGGQTVWTGWY